MELQQFLSKSPEWAREPCLYIVRQTAENNTICRCGASGTHLYQDSDLPYRGGDSLTGLLGRMTMYVNYWLPFKGEIIAALRVSKKLVAEADRDRTNEDHAGNVYNMDRGSRTLVLAREREFHMELDRRGLRWQPGTRNELFQSRLRDYTDLIACLRTIRGKDMYLFTETGIHLDDRYHGGSRRQILDIVDTAPRTTQPRESKVPSVTVRLDKDSMHQLRSGQPAMFARLLNAVQGYLDPPEVVEIPRETVQAMRDSPAVARAVAREIAQPTRRVTRSQTAPRRSPRLTRFE